MKKVISILIVLTITAIAGNSACAAETAARVGYIDMQRILLQSNEGKKAKAALEKQFASRKEELNEKKKELEDLQSSLETQSSILSHDALLEKQAEFVKKRDTFLKLVQQYDKELQEKDSDLTKRILLQVQDIVGTIGEDGHYSVILDRSQGTIMYAPANEDLTDKVLELLNKETAKKKGK